MNVRTHESRLQLKLNLIDRGFIGARPVIAIFYYEHRLDTQLIYQNIQKVLAAAPIFSSRIVIDDGGQQWLEYVPNFFSFGASERLDIDAEQLLTREELLFSDLDGMIDDTPTQVNQPTLGVQITQFRRGTLLALSSSHACSDAESGRLFTTSLALTLMGNKPLQFSPQRSFQLIDQEVTTSTTRYQDHPIARTCAVRPGGVHNIRLKSSEVTDGLAELSDTKCTSHDVIAAWIIKNRANYFLSYQSRVNIRIPVCIRSIIHELDLTYTGNAFVDCFLTWPKAALASMSPRNIAISVREALEEKKDPSYLNERISIDEYGLNYDGFAGDQSQGFDPDNDLIISSIGDFQAKIGGKDLPKFMYIIPAVPLCTMVHKYEDDYLLREFHPNLARSSSSTVYPPLHG